MSAHPPLIVYQISPTDHKSREESINPAHNQRLRDHHHHIPLHHAHHGLHASRIGHGVRRWLAATSGVLKESTTLVGRDEVVLAHLKGLLGEYGGVIPEVDTANESEAFAGFGQRRGRLRGVVHQDGGIVAEDTSKNLMDDNISIYASHQWSR